MPGSPPRRRGKAFSVLRRQFRFRITPAWAGKRKSESCRTTVRRDHPRVGGEKAPLLVDYVFGWGSPPRGRGKGLHRRAEGAWHGITPAWAGKRSERAGIERGRKDHPRVGGEKVALVLMLGGFVGSPPRRRGKDQLVRLDKTAVGITPAWAGKRMQLAEIAIRQRDHPRVGGEKTRVFQQHFPAVGSPPHGRGKDVLPVCFALECGITPAWAGKSVSAVSSARAGRDHPRMGGEK